ncbi:hypothetical protein Slala04_61090 [Streptomyces lavendulae subsp. lavendulae]|nr:hypothetical protein Slala04_61090 [Streptomyces lavendulae subsp. lavendulae]
MNEVSASELLAAWESGSEVSIQAKNALLSGAHFNVWLDPVLAPMLRGTLRRRVTATQRRGRSVVGATECLASLAEMGERGLLVGYVDDRERAGYYFQLYLDPHPLKVIGCVRVGISPGDDPVTGST